MNEPALDPARRLPEQRMLVHGVSWKDYVIPHCRAGDA